MSSGRIYTEFITSEARAHLDTLLTSENNVARYRDSMYLLGVALGEQLFSSVARLSSLCLVSTAEDADYLTRGLLKVLDGLPNLEVALVCFWHERWKVGDNQLRVAPITRRYIEPKSRGQVDAVIVLKSIIATSCVVRTDLTEILAIAQPDSIFIVSPVAYSGSRESLESEFTPEISEKFDYIYFAEDSNIDSSGTVLPGIGGNVYSLLDVQTDTERAYSPRLIKERRQRLAQ